MLSAGGEFQDTNRWAVSDRIVVGIVGLPKPPVGNEIEGVFLDPKALGSLFDRGGPSDSRVVSSVVVFIDKSTEVTRPGNHRAACGVQGHTKAVVGQGIIGNAIDCKPIGKCER